MFGPESRDAREMMILNRTIKWSSEGIEYEADPSHVEIVMEQVGLDSGSKPLSSPCGEKEEVAEESSSQEKSTMYRAITARLNYLAQDRIDIHFAVKELCRFMSSPQVEIWNQLNEISQVSQGKSQNHVQIPISRST